MVRARRVGEGQAAALAAEVADQGDRSTFWNRVLGAPAVAGGDRGTAKVEVGADLKRQILPFLVDHQSVLRGRPGVDGAAELPETGAPVDRGPADSPGTVELSRQLLGILEVGQDLLECADRPEGVPQLEAKIDAFRQGIVGFRQVRSGDEGLLVERDGFAHGRPIHCLVARQLQVEQRFVPNLALEGVVGRGG